MPINKYVSSKTAANYYGCSTRTVRRMWHRGEIDRKKSLNGGYVYELLDTSWMVSAAKCSAIKLPDGNLFYTGKIKPLSDGPDTQVAKLLTWSTIASLIITWGLL